MPPPIVFDWIFPDVYADSVIRKLEGEFIEFAQRVKSLPDVDHTLGMEWYTHPNNFFRTLKEDSNGYILARDRGKIVGALSFLMHQRIIYTRFTIVDADHRRIKLADKMSKMLVSFGRENKFKRIQRYLVGENSRIWHEKWAANPRKMNSGGKYVGPAERLEFDGPYVNIHINRFPNRRWMRAANVWNKVKSFGKKIIKRKIA